MIQESKYEGAATTMRRINRIWLDGQVEDIAPMVHPEIVMVVPGFTGVLRSDHRARMWCSVPSRSRHSRWVDSISVRGQLINRGAKLTISVGAEQCSLLCTDHRAGPGDATREVHPSGISYQIPPLLRREIALATLER